MRIKYPKTQKNYSRQAFFFGFFYSLLAQLNKKNYLSNTKQ